MTPRETDQGAKADSIFYGGRNLFSQKRNAKTLRKTDLGRKG
jgi:hypothetical protein